MNRLCVSPFLFFTESAHIGYYFPKVETKDYNVVIDGRNFFDQPVKNDKKKLKILEKLILVTEMITQLVFY